MFRKILVPTDFSEAAEAAVRVAARWAKHFDAQVGILHVDEDFESGLHDAEEMLQFVAQVEQRRQDALEAARFVVESEGAHAFIERRRGDAAMEIRSVAAERGYDLIVIASRARRGLRRLIGSTASRVLRRLETPTLVLGDTSREAARESGPVGRILYPTDFSTPSVSGLRWSVELARAWGATMEVLHVMQLPTFMPATPGEPAIPVPHEVNSRREQAFRNKLDELCATGSDVDMSYRVTIAPAVGAGIADFAERYSFDLVVIPAHGHGALHDVLFGSVAAATVELCTRPVLILPPKRA